MLDRVCGHWDSFAEGKEQRGAAGRRAVETPAQLPALPRLPSLTAYPEPAIILEELTVVTHFRRTNF